MNSTIFVRNRTPLTHQRFLNRHKGSYGPAIRAGEASFPFPGTPVDGLLVCGDSVFPGIGVPGKYHFIAQNSLSNEVLSHRLCRFYLVISRRWIWNIGRKFCQL